ncbi:Inner membrane protein YdjM [Neomoorella glycerini]|uniref:Inner membrane protein YdjM n=1 Tax=Neomoorella glycerini TaxID=55779 RepID=A0A6I5ZUN9_9FIRM|nr:metal-dependent hydrolase [Moorella glycerini]QGP93355.1 Inner membrane protein YdjM [Moorella glycerini]
MRGSTHLFSGLAAFSLLGMNLPGLGLAALGALLPDIDQPGSMISRKVTGVPFGRIGRGLVGITILGVWHQTRLSLLLPVGITFVALAFLPHRGITHSLLGLVLAWLAVKGLGWPEAPFLTGYGIHLAEDLLTPSGIPLLYPWQERMRVPLVETGGILDRVLGLAAMAIFLIAAWKYVPVLLH